MPDTPLSYDDICRHVGRLYLTLQHTLDRQDAVHAARVRQLTEELAAARREAAAARPGG